MVPKKKHHYIPQFYLREFSDPYGPKGQEPYVWVYEKRMDKLAEKRSPKNIATETHFYSVSGVTSTRIQAVEDALSRFESRVAPLLREVLSSRQVPQGKERLLFAYFLAVMLTRTLKVRQEINAAMEDLVRKMNVVITKSEDRLRAVIRRMERDIGERIHMPITELRKFMLNGKFEIVPSKEWSLMAITEVAPSLVPMLAEMRWKLFVSPNQSVYITSDSPVVIAESGTSRLFSPSGLLTNNVMVTFPLSPRVCLALRWRGTDGCCSATKRGVLETNKRTIVFAQKYVFSSKYLKSVQSLVRSSRTAKTMTLKVELG